ncbi:MAG TPA: Amuc_1102 family pilus-like protein [Luteolibacter sp.]|nr:Amuc_1102 family pilus-like protein [Luteolibacter sp.]
MIPACRRVVAGFCLATAMLVPCAAFGQAAYEVTAEKPVCESLPSPEYGAGKKKFDPKMWLALEAKIKVEPSKASSPPKGNTCERLKVRWYLLVDKLPEGQSSANGRLLFTKEIEHVNIPLNEEVHCSVYLSPASLHRLTGQNLRDASKAAVQWGYEVEIDGKILRGASDGQLKLTQADWWNIQSNLVERSTLIELLDKSKTPFNPLWWDRYAEIAPSDKP